MAEITGKDQDLSVKNNTKKTSKAKRRRTAKSDYEKTLAKVVKLKEKKFNLKYDKCEELPEYKAYRMFLGSETYGEYKHRACFYGVPVLKRDDMFKWYQMFFEVKADMVFMQENAPSKEGYAKNVPTSSSIWTSKQMKALRDYVLNWENPLSKKTKSNK